MGTDPIPANARADNFKLKKALWAENDKEIRLELDQKEKVKNIIMPNKKIERNFMVLFYHFYKIYYIIFRVKKRIH